MKRISVLIVMVVALTSCFDHIFPEPSGPKKQLCIDARLYSSDTTHEVLVYISGYDSIEYVGDANVSIYLNGELADEVTYGVPYPSSADQRHLPAVYKLSARFNERDKVKIVAKKDDLHAEAEVEVLDRPHVGGVSCKVVEDIDPKKGTLAPYLVFEARIEDDSPQIQYYLVDVYCRKTCVRDKDGHIVDSLEKNLKMDVSKDPVLSENFASVFDNSGSSSYGIYDDFSYWAFNNTSFRGSAHILTLRTCDLRELDPFHGHQSDIYGEWEKFTMTISFDIRVSRVPAIIYNQYMKCVFKRSQISFLLLFDDTSGYPSNVQGGAGIVSAFSTDVKTIELGPFHYDYFTRYDWINQI